MAGGIEHHRLAPLMAPRSVALVGASRREGTVGRAMVETLRRGGFAGTVHCINPRYDEVDGWPCLPALAALPAPPDVAVLSVAARRMEVVFDEALAAGARALVIFDPCFFAGDGDPPLLARLKALAAEAGVPVCGGNGMGVVNLDAGAWLSFQGPARPLQGGIAAICHSGSVFSLLADSNARHRFNLLVSPGQEIGASAADYLDYALAMPTTRAVVLFLEAVRDPPAFLAALAGARRRAVPVVAVKIGRCPASAALAASHCGAATGDDGAFDAVCESHGVVRARDLDEAMATAQLLACRPLPGAGGLGVVTDSGGLREQLADLAWEMGVPFAPLAPATVAALREALAFGLEPVNPLDAAGPLSGDFARRFDAAALALARDPHVAIVAHELFADDHACFYPEAVRALETMPGRSGKPHLLFCSLAAAENDGVALRFQNAGIPAIDGARTMLAAVAHALAWRDRRAAPDDAPEASPAAAVERWRRALARGAAVDGLALLADFGVATAGGGGTLAFEARRDPQFGPVVAVAPGGALAGLIDERACALAPFGQARARRLLGRLKAARALDDEARQCLAAALARFSVLAAALADALPALAIGSVAAGPAGALAAELRLGEG